MQGNLSPSPLLVGGYELGSPLPSILPHGMLTSGCAALMQMHTHTHPQCGEGVVSETNKMNNYLLCKATRPLLHSPALSQQSNKKGD